MATLHLAACGTRKLHVHRLRTDNAAEFTSEAFTNYLWRSGTSQEFASPYTPQQMGLVESVWRPLADFVRIALHDTKLPASLWAEFMHAQTHIRNRLPMITNPQHQSPYKMWFDKEPDMSHLRILGSRAYVHEERAQSKLLPRSWAGVLVGYNHEGHQHSSISYRVYDHERNHVYVSRNVTFIEPKVAAGDTNASVDDDSSDDGSTDEETVTVEDVPGAEPSSAATPVTTAQRSMPTAAVPPPRPVLEQGGVQGDKHNLYKRSALVVTRQDWLHQHQHQLHEQPGHHAGRQVLASALMYLSQRSIHHSTDTISARHVKALRHWHLTLGPAQHCSSTSSAWHQITRAALHWLVR
jgi:hypothetical protein